MLFVTTIIYDFLAAMHFAAFGVRRRVIFWNIKNSVWFGEHYQIYLSGIVSWTDVFLFLRRTTCAVITKLFRFHIITHPTR